MKKKKSSVGLFLLALMCWVFGVGTVAALISGDREAALGCLLLFICGVVIIAKIDKKAAKYNRSNNAAGTTKSAGNKVTINTTQLEKEKAKKENAAKAAKEKAEKKAKEKAEKEAKEKQEQELQAKINAVLEAIKAQKVNEIPASSKQVCSNCGKELFEGAPFCMYCGTKVEEESKHDDGHFCSNCGNELMENAEFCMYCGTPVDSFEASVDDEEIVLEAGICPVCKSSVSDVDSICCKCGFPVISMSVNYGEKEVNMINDAVLKYRNMLGK